MNLYKKVIIPNPNISIFWTIQFMGQRKRKNVGVSRAEWFLKFHYKFPLELRKAKPTLGEKMSESDAKNSPQTEKWT